MAIFSLESICKKYFVPRAQKGFWQGAASLFLRNYEQKVALDNVSFAMNEGEIAGYIGPNGAGKSTTVKILTGILAPDSGQVEVLGKIPWEHRIEIVRQIGVVFGQRTQLWWDLQVIESFELLRSMYTISSSDYKRTLDNLIEIMDLSELLTIPVRMLSLGQRMRCDLAASLLHSPKILFLDEPTIGLDAVSKLAMRDYIQYLNKEKKVTILLTTHDMDDIEFLCKRVMILNHGSITFDGSIDRLKRMVSPERYLVIDLLQDSESIREENLQIVKQEGHRIWLQFNPEVIPVAKLISHITSKYAVVDLFLENPSIEETISRLYNS